VQAELNVLAMAMDCLVEIDDGDGDVYNVEGEVPAGFQSHDFDESMVLGIMGMIDTTLPDENQGRS
jgi:hypothetical protein